MELKLYYHIVPVDDGTTYLCYNKDLEKFFLYRKDKETSPYRLVFRSEDTANKWIKDNRIGKNYKVEGFLSVLDYQTRD